MNKNLPIIFFILVRQSMAFEQKKCSNYPKIIFMLGKLCNFQNLAPLWGILTWYWGYFANNQIKCPIYFQKKSKNHFLI